MGQKVKIGSGSRCQKKIGVCFRLGMVCMYIDAMQYCCIIHHQTYCKFTVTADLTRCWPNHRQQTEKVSLAQNKGQIWTQHAHTLHLLKELEWLIDPLILCQHFVNFFIFELPLPGPRGDKPDSFWTKFTSRAHRQRSKISRTPQMEIHPYMWSKIISLTRRPNFFSTSDVATGICDRL